VAQPKTDSKNDEENHPRTTAMVVYWPVEISACSGLDGGGNLLHPSRCLRACAKIQRTDNHSVENRYYT